jgi:uncharacterized protein YlxP (DUF503 family)
VASFWIPQIVQNTKKRFTVKIAMEGNTDLKDMDSVVEQDA